MTYKLIINSFFSLKDYCEQEKFKGWDPYDGLNSKIFQATPLKKNWFARWVWIQVFKRNPINLRHLLRVPKEYNPKGLGLLLTGYCNLYKIVESGNTDFGTKEEITKQINHLANLLIELQSEGFSGACWGYNFDWQARSFFFPKYTPSVVVTSFCVTALLQAYEITQNEDWKEIALSSKNFIQDDLNRKQKKNGFLFSYSPLDGNNSVFNASLLGSRTLSLCYKYEKDSHLKKLARKSVNACADAQNPDGSWVYGESDTQQWIDNFHTGYNLEAINCYQELTGDTSFAQNLEKGFEYYISTFFKGDGTPKYYHNQTYPIDIHSPAQLIVTLSRCNKFAQHKDLAERVLNWTISHMQDEKGYFYYQMKRTISSKIPYMRWSSAFMFYGMSYYLLEMEKSHTD